MKSSWSLPALGAENSGAGVSDSRGDRARNRSSPTQGQAGLKLNERASPQDINSLSRRKVNGGCFAPSASTPGLRSRKMAGVTRNGAPRRSRPAGDGRRGSTGKGRERIGKRLGHTNDRNHQFINELDRWLPGELNRQLGLCNKVTDQATIRRVAWRLKGIVGAMRR
jgi:hypothetical protein